MSDSKFEKMFNENWKTVKEKGVMPNVLILGGTGTGKSTLVNLIFGIDVATVSHDSPETKGFKRYGGKDYNAPINIFDSEGYELSSTDLNPDNSIECYKQDVLNFIKKRNKNVEEAVHLIWYCTSIAGKRIQKIDYEIIELISALVPNKIAIVFTKCDQDDENGSIAKEFRRLLSHELKDHIVSFETSNDIRLKDVLDLNSLIEWSIKNLDNDDLKAKFIKAQFYSLEEKKKAATKIIKISAGAAATVGVTPFPFADAALLVPIQLNMCAIIINAYGLDIIKGTASALVGQTVISTIGKKLSTGIIKLIPVIGQTIGPVINAAVASSITMSLGYTISEICFNICKSVLNGETVDVKEAFSQNNIEKYFKMFNNMKKN